MEYLEVIFKIVHLLFSGKISSLMGKDLVHEKHVGEYLSYGKKIHRNEELFRELEM